MFVRAYYNRLVKMKQINIFHTSYENKDDTNPPIRLCYRGKCHYDSVRDNFNAGIGVGLGFANFEPGKADRDLFNASKAASDLCATQGELERVVVEESIREFESKKQKTTTTTNNNNNNSNESIVGLSTNAQLLVMNGFLLENVLIAQDVVGDDYEEMLKLLCAQ